MSHLSWWVHLARSGGARPALEAGGGSSDLRPVHGGREARARDGHEALDALRELRHGPGAQVTIESKTLKAVLIFKFQEL